MGYTVDYNSEGEIENDGPEYGFNSAYLVVEENVEHDEENENKEEINQEFEYMLLDRLKSDCKYFLGNGNRYEKHLWAGNVDKQIKKMKELYEILHVKPEWCTWEDILEYERLMKNEK